MDWSLQIRVDAKDEVMLGTLGKKLDWGTGLSLVDVSYRVEFLAKEKPKCACVDP